MDMQIKKKFFALFLATAALFFSIIISVQAQVKITEQSKVFINGIGAIRVGMTVKEASKAAGMRLVSKYNSPDTSCYYVEPEKQPKDIGFMVTNGRISRVDVFQNSRITTAKGAKIGDTESRIKALYPGQIQVSRHKYELKGHYLTFIPRDRADKNYRLLFETNGDRVTGYRAGKLPEVEWVEGCS